MKVKVKFAQSCLTLCDPMNYMYSPWNSPGQNTGVGSLSLDRKSTRLNSSHSGQSRMPSSA